uniref:Glycosyl transferase group 1 n=1 Tax=Cyanothece sp. (strain PCC 7425 / ATCC 29141) TaxID=395961 RepID=B8HSR2_CYAP4
MPPLRILTWHVHGSYLYYLVQCPHQFFLPIKPGYPEGYGGRLAGLAWPDNVHNIAAEQVKDQVFDCILFQSQKNYQVDQYEILSPSQQQLPRIYLEHDPPRQHPTDSRHPVDDPNVLLVHVTPFNQLMWDSGQTPTRVIEHGVIIPDRLHYRGELERGVVVVNGLRSRGRRLGADLFAQIQSQVPLDLIGMDSEQMGGLGNFPHDRLLEILCHYRFFFNPIRYTSLGLAVCEAMQVGLPIVGLATTELTTVVENGVSGYVDTNPAALLEVMNFLLDEPDEAHRWGAAARTYALERFSIHRFIRDWQQALALVTSTPTYPGTSTTHPGTSTTHPETPTEQAGTPTVHPGTPTIHLEKLSISQNKHLSEPEKHPIELGKHPTQLDRHLTEGDTHPMQTGTSATPPLKGAGDPLKQVSNPLASVSHSPEQVGDRQSQVTEPLKQVGALLSGVSHSLKQAGEPLRGGQS